MTLYKLPIVCLVVSLARFLLGKLVFSRSFIRQVIRTENDEPFMIFRHVGIPEQKSSGTGAVLLIRFRFNALPDCLNRFISLFPMLLITGFPGFRTKMYAVNHENGYWMGLYEWKSLQALRDYRGSFVLKVMNRRASAGSVTYRELPGTNLSDYIEAHQC